MSLQSLFNQFITVYSKTSYDGYGREVAPDGTIYTARVQQVTKQRYSLDGSPITISLIVYTLSTTVVEVEDKVSFGGVYYRVFGKSTAVDGRGSTNHLKLELVKWLPA